MKFRSKKYLRSSVALTLVAAILLASLTGCDNTTVESSTIPPDSTSSTSTAEPSGDESAALAQATYVEWSSSGEYTTTLTSEDADLSDIEAEDILIFTIPVSETEAESEEDLPDPISYPVKSVNKNGDSLDITFTDDKAADKSADCYIISIDKKNLGAAVLVDYPTPEVTLEGSGILVSDEDPEIVLTLNSGLFAAEVKPEQISLAGSFSEMEVAEVTPSSNKLTVKLSGKAEIPDGQSVYVDGIIGINPTAMENEHASASVRVPILQSLTMFDASKMTVDGETVTVPLNVIGEENIDGITANDIVFDSTTINDDDEEESLPAVTVTAVEKTDDTTLNVTMTVTGAKDKNSAAALLDGRTVTLRGNAFTANFHAASIYPLFDYVEEDGDNLKLGLIIGAQGGTLSSDFNAEQITLGEDFADGTIISAERTDDVTAAVTVSVPANGQTKEEFYYNGSVILKEGALINSWGDKTDAATEYIRSYTQDSVGRSVASLENLAGYSMLVRRLGIANGILMGATIGFAITTLALELSGAVKTAAQQVMEINESINRNLDDTFDVIKQNSGLIDDVEDILLQKYLNDFNLKLAMLNTYVQKFSHYYSPGMLKLLGYEDGLEEINDDDPIDVKVAKLKQRKEVAQAVFDAENSRDSNIAHYFRDYFSTYTTMREYYNSVCSMLKLKSANNPINAYSKLLSRTTNFDTTAYRLKKNYVDAIRSSLIFAYADIDLFNLRSTTINSDGTVKLRAVASTANKDFNTISAECEKVLKNLDGMGITELKTEDGVTYYDKIYCYTFGVYVDSLDSEHSDIFWAKTWRGQDKNGISVDNAKTSYAKGGSVFVYSHNKDYEQIIKDSVIAPSYIGPKNYNWGEELFSQKAPDGFDKDAIYADKTEDIIAASAEKFVKRMNGRTLREEIELAGIPVDKDIFEKTEGLPLSSTVIYSQQNRPGAGISLDSDYDITEAATYMNMVKWDDKYMTKLVPASTRRVYTAHWDEINKKWHNDWCSSNKTGIGGMTAAEYCKYQEETFADMKLGNKNLVPIVRWVIETPGEDGTSPARDYTMYMVNSDEDEKPTESTESDTSGTESGTSENAA